MTPRQATIESMNEISVALIAIALVLSAVFLPMAFFGGSTGVIYRQFSLTIVSAMVLSVLVALILSPGADRDVAEAEAQEERESKGFKKHLGKVAEWGESAGNWFNRTFEKTVTRYTGAVQRWWIASGCSC